METTSGIARPSACGQAITKTVMVRTTAVSDAPKSDQIMAVMIAAVSANQKSQPAAVSAIRCAREDDACASETNCWIPAHAVSSPMAGTSTPIPESVAVTTTCDDTALAGI